MMQTTIILMTPAATMRSWYIVEDLGRIKEVLLFHQRKQSQWRDEKRWKKNGKLLKPKCCTLISKNRRRMSNFKVRHAYLSFLTTKIGILHENLCTLYTADAGMGRNKIIWKQKCMEHSKRRDIDRRRFPNATTELSHVHFNWKLFTYSYKCDVKWKLDLNSTNKIRKKKKMRTMQLCLLPRTSPHTFHGNSIQVLYRLMDRIVSDARKWEYKNKIKLENQTGCWTSHGSMLGTKTTTIVCVWQCGTRFTFTFI